MKEMHGKVPTPPHHTKMIVYSDRASVTRICPDLANLPFVTKMATNILLPHGATKQAPTIGSAPKSE